MCLNPPDAVWRQRLQALAACQHDEADEMLSALGCARLSGPEDVVSRATHLRRAKLIQIAREILKRLEEMGEAHRELAWRQIHETFAYLLGQRDAAWWIMFDTLPPYNLFWLMYYLK